jgi:hypothetical protein
MAVSDVLNRCPDAHSRYRTNRVAVAARVRSTRVGEPHFTQKNADFLTFGMRSDTFFRAANKTNDSPSYDV